MMTKIKQNPRRMALALFVCCMLMVFLLVGLFFIMPLKVSGAETYTSNDNVEWTYTKSGYVATITDCGADSGAVTIPSASELGASTIVLGSELFSLKNITSVTMNNSVTSIGTKAFKGCTALLSVVFPSNDKFTSISSYTFEDCSSLISIAIPDSVVSIGSYAFSGCLALEDVTFPDNINFKVINSYAFQNCSSLASLTIPNSITSVGASAFKGCIGISSISLPDNDNFTAIRNYTFQDCSSITSVTIPGAVESIGTSAFSGCSSIERVTIPDSVTTIGSNAFNGCSSFETLTMGGNHSLSSTSLARLPRDQIKTLNINGTIIKDNAFTDFTGPISMSITSGVTSIGASAFSGCTNLESVTIPDTVKSIDSQAFKKCSSLTSLTIPQGVTKIGSGAFNGCSALTSVTFPSNSSFNAIQGVTFNGCSALEEIVIPEGVTLVGGSAFNGCSNLSNITIPDSVTTIGSSAFNGCSSLKVLTISGNHNLDATDMANLPRSQITNLNITGTIIKDSAFEGLSEITSIIIPSSITAIGSGAFDGCYKFKTITMDGSHNIVNADLANLPLEQLTTLNITGTRIKDSAFIGFTGLTSLSLEYGIGSIGDSAFSGCSNIRSVAIPVTVESIGTDAFRGCSNFRELTIDGDHGLDSVSISNLPRSLISTLNITGTKVKASAFIGFTGIKDLMFQYGVESIGASAFDNCYSIESLVIPSTVTSVGENAFRNCSNLQTLTIDGNHGLKSADLDELNKTQIKTLNITGSAINDNAFDDFSYLESVTISRSITSICSRPFRGCTCISSIKVDSENANFKDISGNLYDKAGTVLIQYSVGKTDSFFEIPSGVTNVSSYAFEGCSSLFSLSITSDVENIGTNAFEACPNLIMLTIPGEHCLDYEDLTNLKKEQIKKIDIIGTKVKSGAFTDFSAVESVNFLGSITSIGNSAFEGCAELRTLVEKESPGLDDIIFTDEDTLNVFFGRRAVKRASNAVGASGKQSLALDSDSKSVEITIPESVTSIGSSAFKGCVKFTSVKLPKNSGYNTISDSTFQNCSALKDITIPSNITGIGSRAFANCVKLKSMIIPSSISILGTGAFEGCSGIVDLTTPGNSGFNYDNLPKDSVTTLTVTGSGIKADAFKNCPNLSNVNIPDTVESVGTDAFDNCPNFLTLTIPGEHGLSVTDLINLNNDQITNVFITGSAIQSKAFTAFSALKRAIFFEDIIRIGDNAFEGCSNLVVLGQQSSPGFDDIIFYGEDELEVFFNKRAVKRVTNPTGAAGKSILLDSSSSLGVIIIPDTVTSIGTAAFKGCASFTSVELPKTNSFTTIKDSTFMNCSSLESIIIPSSVTSIGDSAFEGCGNLKYGADIPNIVTYIGSSAFKDCSSLTDVELPSNSGFTTIHNHTFQNCSSLTSIGEIPSSVTSIGDSAFEGCSKLKNGVDIPSIVTYIGPCAFKDCSSLTDVELPSNNGFTTIHNHTFQNCSSLTSIGEIPSSVTSIGESAFDGCSKIASGLRIPPAVTQIGAAAFRDCARLVSATLPSNDSFHRLNSYTFSGCSSLESVTIPGNVTSLGTDVFCDCSKLSSLEMAGDSAMNSTNLAKLPKSQITDLVITGTQIKARTFINFTSVSSLVIPNTVTSIGNTAFKGCVNLREITLPDNPAFTELSNYTFMDCAKLNSVTIPNTVSSIGAYVFTGCSSLNSITLPTNDNFKIIDSYTFHNCTGLQSITIPSSVDYISNNAFDGCSNLDEIDFCGRLTYVGDNAFNGCKQSLSVGAYEESAASAFAASRSLPFSPLFGSNTGSGYSAARLTGTQSRDSGDSSFGFTQSSCGNFELLSAKSDGEGGIRFVAVINEGIIHEISQNGEVEDYGFVVAKCDSSSTAQFGEDNIQSLTLGSQGVTALSCRQTSNSSGGDYGVYNAPTRYKYVTLSVTNVPQTRGIAVRFYVRMKSGNVYYAGYNSDYTGCVAVCSQFSSLFFSGAVSPANIMLAQK